MTRKTKYIALKNGAKLVYSAFPFGGNATGVFVGFFCGAASTKNGMPHLVEHCILEGTTKHSHEELNTLANTYGYFMPVTYEDVMGIIIYCSNRKLEQALELAKEVLLDCTFPEEAIKKQVGIVKQEREKRRNKYMANMRSMHHMFITKKFADLSEYGSYWTGSDEFLDSVSHQALEDFKKDNFVSNKFIMFASSTLPASKLKRLYNKIFLPSLGANDQPALTPVRDVIRQTPSIQIVPKSSSVIELVLSIKDAGPYSDEYIAFNYDRDFIGYAAETRVTSIMNRLRDEGYSYDPHVFFNSYDHSYCFTITLTTTSIENLEPIFKVIGECIADFKANGVSEELIEQYKDWFRDSQDMPSGLKDNSSKVDEMIMNYHHHQEHDPANGVSDKEYVRHCESSTQSSIKQVIDKIFDPNNDVFITLGGNIEPTQIKSLEEYKKLLFPTKD